MCAKLNHSQQPQPPSLRSALPISQRSDPRQLSDPRGDLRNHLPATSQAIFTAKRENRATKAEGSEVQGENRDTRRLEPSNSLRLSGSIPLQILIRHLQAQLKLQRPPEPSPPPKNGHEGPVHSEALNKITGRRGQAKDKRSVRIHPVPLREAKRQKKDSLLEGHLKQKRH